MGKVTNYFKNKEYIEEYRPYGLATTSHKDGTPEVYTEEDKKTGTQTTKIYQGCGLLQIESSGSPEKGNADDVRYTKITGMVPDDNDNPHFVNLTRMENGLGQTSYSGFRLDPKTNEVEEFSVAGYEAIQIRENPANPEAQAKAENFQFANITYTHAIATAMREAGDKLPNGVTLGDFHGELDAAAGALDMDMGGDQ